MGWWWLPNGGLAAGWPGRQSGLGKDSNREPKAKVVTTDLRPDRVGGNYEALDSGVSMALGS